jgi:hypothetical protein
MYSMTEGSSNPSMSLNSSSSAFVLNRISTNEIKMEIEKVIKLTAKINFAIAWY